MAQSVNRTLEVLESANRRQQELSHTLYQTTLAQKQAQLNSYKNQISPHFLFNTLESMRSIAHHAKVPVLENMLTSLASLFRYSLRSSLVVPLRDELNHVQSYFNVMDIRTPQRYEAAPQDRREHAELPYAFHGLAAVGGKFDFPRVQPKKGALHPSHTGQSGRDGVLNLSVIDNGTGISPDKLRELDQHCRQEGDPLQNSHIGLDNVLHRLRLFYGKGSNSRCNRKRSTTPPFPSISPNSPATPLGRSLAFAQCIF